LCKNGGSTRLISGEIMSGDHLSLSTDSRLLRVLAQSERILFSDKADKINRKGQSQHRIILCTSLAVYNLGETRRSIKRRIPLSFISRVTVSAHSSEIVLHVPREYDYRWSVHRKAEIADCILAAGSALGVEIEICISGQISLRDITRTAPGSPPIESSYDNVVKRNSPASPSVHDLIAGVSVIGKSNGYSPPKKAADFDAPPSLFPLDSAGYVSPGGRVSPGSLEGGDFSESEEGGSSTASASPASLTGTVHVSGVMQNRGISGAVAPPPGYSSKITLQNSHIYVSTPVLPPPPPPPFPHSTHFSTSNTFTRPVHANADSRVSAPQVKAWSEAGAGVNAVLNKSGGKSQFPPPFIGDTSFTSTDLSKGSSIPSHMISEVEKNRAIGGGINRLNDKPFDSQEYYQSPVPFISNAGIMSTPTPGQDVLECQSARTLSADTITLDSFEMLRVVGRGSYGKVLQVRKKDTGEILAMKVLHKSVVVNRSQVEHIQAERAILESIDHPFLIRLRFAFQTESKLFMIMQFMRGGEVFHHLKSKKTFDEDLARFYAAEIALGIGHLHAVGVVYRDLKPENVLLDADGHIKLTDFGLAKVLTQPDETARTFCGTPEYLAPEVIDGLPHDKSVDWWSLGVLIWEMLTGAPPFYDTNVQVMYEMIRAARLVFPGEDEDGEKSIKNVFGSSSAPGSPVNESLASINSSSDVCTISPLARSLLVELLAREPSKRLGNRPGDNDVEAIKAHPFFASVDWNAVLAKRVSPPWKPEAVKATDVSHFDKDFTQEPVTDSVTPNAGNSFVAPVFEGFTFMTHGLSSGGRSGAGGLLSSEIV